MNNLRNIWSLLDTFSKNNFFLLLLIILFNAFLEMLSITLIIPLLSILIQKDNELVNFFKEYNLENLTPYVNIENVLLLLIIAFLAKTFFKIYTVHFQSHYTFSFLTNLLSKLFRQYLLQEYVFHKNNNSAKLIRNLLSEVHSVSIGYFGAIISIITESITIIAIFFVLFFYEPKVSILLVSIILLVISTFTFFIKKKSKKLGKEKLHFSYINVNYIMQSLGGIKEIIVNLKENEVLEKFIKNAKKLKKVNYLISILGQLPRIFIEFFVVLILILLVFYLLKLEYSNEKILIYFGLLVASFSRILPSVNKISASVISLNYYKPSVKVIKNELKNIESKNLDRKENLNFNNNNLFNEKIEIKNLSFSYEDKKIFHELNLVIKKGERIGICGESGCGKSTLVDIIIGLLNPTSGSVNVDGVNISSFKSHWYAQIGYVPQEVFINDDTLKNNIVFYENESFFNRELFEKTLKISQLINFYEKNQGNINRNLGERGSSISGGQKQRVGLARALYKNSQILIFDESTNSLDTETEENFLKDIYNLGKDKTIIIISHNKKILDRCDKIFFIHDKKIKNV